jgi:CBS domain-containing protein
MKLHSLVGGSAEVVGPETTVEQAAQVMRDEGVAALVVVDRHSFVGIFTEFDVVKAVAGEIDPQEATVAEWMSEAPDTFSPDVEVDEAITWLMETGYRHLPVVGDGELLGVVSVRDLLWATTQASID